MQWVEYYYEIVERLTDITDNVFMTGFRSKIAHILTHFSTKILIFRKSLNFFSSKHWYNFYHVIRLQ